MPRSRKSAGSPRRSKPRHSALGRRVIAGLRDALAHARGETKLPEYTVTVPERVNVAQLRKALGLSQSAFARRFGLDVTAIHAWEQGRRCPDRAARVLLAVIAREPEAVRRALAE
ncbi:MAG: helix-turn-helix domain-containing protein [Proteobacteria bacterium]|nr:helix-turn-helix domain-containing protein [Pseudomonadota bacterium]MBI3499435.1 helix-turn-helix domain-containing protein [Pseudomonadota bacterium]